MAHELSAGSVFAGYRIERMLGAGGMGTVYLARNPDLPRSEALKVLAAELSRDLDFRHGLSAKPMWPRGWIIPTSWRFISAASSRVGYGLRCSSSMAGTLRMRCGRRP